MALGGRQEDGRERRGIGEPTRDSRKTQPMKTEPGVRITTARFKNFSIYRPSCMNAYKNSIREYGRPLPLRALLPSPSPRTGLRAVEAPRRESTTGMLLTPLDLRLEYLIDGALLAHACTSTANRGDAFRETLVRDAAGRAFVLPFVLFPKHSPARARASHFSKRALRSRCDRLVISGGIEKGGTAA